MNDPTTIDLTDVKNPFTLAFLALCIGAAVRILRTKKVGDWLDSLPPSWIKRVPKDWLPWIANGLGMLIVFLDLVINNHVNWRQAVIQTIFGGVFAGSLAVSGHETVAKALGKAIYKPKGPIDPQGPLGPDDPTLDPKDEAKPPMKTALQFVSGVLAAILTLTAVVTTTTGCGVFGAVSIGDVIAAVVDGGQIIDAIESFVASYFAQHPNAETQTKVADAITRARQALNVALRAAQAAKDTKDANVDAAFDDFKNAYLALMQLVQPLGVQMNAGPTLKVTPGNNGATLGVPEPLAFKKAASK